MLIIFRALRLDSGRRSSLVMVLTLACGVLGPAFDSTLRAQTQDAALEVRQFDRIVLRDSVASRKKIWEGEITAENDDEITLKSGSVSQVFAKLDILRIERRNPPDQVYKRRARRAANDSAEDQFELAKWCLNYQLLEQARDHLEQTIRLAPETEAAYPPLLAIYVAQLDRNRSRERRDSEVGVCRAGLEAGISQPDLNRVLARNLEYFGDAALAVEYWLDYLESESLSEPERVAAIKKTVRLYEQLGDQDRAREFLNSHSSSGDLEIRLIEADWQLERLARGEDDAWSELDRITRQVLDVESENAQAHLLRACALTLRRQFSAANEAYKRAFGVDQGPAVCLSWALCMAQQKQEKTDELATKLLATQYQNAKDSEDPHLFSQYRLIESYLLENNGNIEEALRLLESAAEQATDWQTRAIYHYTLDRLERSQDLRDRVAEQALSNSQNSVAFAENCLLLADMALRAGEGGEARRWIGYALEVSPADFEVCLRAGVAELEAGGDLARAREYLGRASAIDPKSVDLRNALGCLEYRLGNYDAARGWFRGVISEFENQISSAPEVEENELPPELLYAREADQKIESVLREEVWIDSFTQPDGKVVNNWQTQVGFGIDVQQVDSEIEFRGQQQFEADGLTILNRVVRADRLTRVRCRVKLGSGTDALRVGLRLEDKSGARGLVFYRDPDGVLAFAINSGSGEPSVHRPRDEDPDENSEGAAEENRLNLKRLVWRDDGQYHQLEIRLDSESSRGARLYFDDVQVAENVSLPLGRSGEIMVGVSGQADLGIDYQFVVDDFEIFRKRLAETDRSRR